MTQKDHVLILTGDGFGGAMDAMKIAQIIRHSTSLGKFVHVGYYSRNDIFKPFHYLFQDKYTIHQLPVEDQDKCLTDNDYILGLAEKFQCEELIIHWPDLVYRNSYAFNPLEYNTSLSAIKQIKTLTHKFKPIQKNVYINLFSSTPGYLYDEIPCLIANLANELPDYTFNVPWITHWAGKDIDMGELYDNMPKNAIIYHNPDIIEQIDICCKSCYSVVADNGFSHLSHNLNMEYLLLDPQYGNNAFCSRWRENNWDKSIPLECSVGQIIKVVKDNLLIPQSNLIPRTACLSIQDYTKELLLKC